MGTDQDRYGRMGGLSDQRGRRCRKFYAAVVSLPKRFLGKSLDRSGPDAMIVYIQFLER